MAAGRIMKPEVQANAAAKTDRAPLRPIGRAQGVTLPLRRRGRF
jgi:hypothetical protein